MTDLENDSPEQDVEELDSPDEAGPNEPAIREFLADKRHIRFEETDSNWEAIERYLQQHDLPVTVCSLALSYEQLSESGELELLSPGRERTADEKTEGEVQAEKQKQAEPERTSENEIAKDARATLRMFQERTHGTMTRYRNGARVG